MAIARSLSTIIPSTLLLALALRAFSLACGDDEEAATPTQGPATSAPATGASTQSPVAGTQYPVTVTDPGPLTLVAQRLIFIGRPLRTRCQAGSGGN